MSRQIPITLVTQSGGSPGYFTLGTTIDNVSGDWTSVFLGKYYRQQTTPFTTQPFYTSPTTPAGYDLIVATQFDVVSNASYAGRYTVYTPVSSVDTHSTLFSGGTTQVRVNEAVGSPLSPGDTTTGFVQNVSTYYIYRSGSATAIVVPPGVSIGGPLESPGRNFSGWGEIFNQDLSHLLESFAAASTPANPILGMQWYDLSTGLLKIYDGTSFSVINASAFAPASSYRHTQSSSSTTWTINHNLNAATPFLVNASFFVDTGGGVYKPIIPSDVTYVTANQLTVTFTSAYAGYALIRL